MSTSLFNSAATQVTCNLHVGDLLVGSNLQLILGTCAMIAVAVFATMLYSIVRFQTSASMGLTAVTRSKTTEVLWALIPIAILIGTAVPTVKTLLMTDQTCAPTTYGSAQLH